MLVSVIMPVYKAGPYLKGAIESILNQSFKDFELIVVNDGSTDEDTGVINSFNDKRIRHIEIRPNKGLINALNQGLDMASGKYIARMDADDISHTDRLMHQLTFMERNEVVALCGTARKIIDGAVNPVEEADGKLRAMSIINSAFFHPTVFIRRSLLEKHSLRYDAAYPHAEDNALWLEIMKYAQVANLNLPLLDYRVHAQQVSSVFRDIQKINSTKKRIEILRAIGVDIVQAEESLYLKFCYKEPLSDPQDFDVIESLLQAVKDKLKTYKEFDYEYLKILFNNRLDLLYRLSAHLGLDVYRKYRKSRIVFHKKDQTRLLIKSILKN
jgi:glycosyltransferase involved in cell wall biosynthesis